MYMCYYINNEKEKQKELFNVRKDEKKWKSSKKKIKSK